jgi:tRNA/rRNA methyltransferase
MAGTDASARPVLGGPAVILVAPQLGQNIGAAARAMLNFGLTELRLVNPRDGWPNEEARAMASRADPVLDGARVYPGIAEALADLHLVVATSARRRDMAKPLWSPARAAVALRQAEAAGQATGLLFGGERAGLDNDDIARAQAVVEVPANPAFASLNLAQAVLLMGYEWFQAGAPELGPEAGLTLSPPATAAELDNFMRRLEAALDAAGFFRPPEKRPIMRRALLNVFARARLGEQELRTLHGVLSALLREPPDGTAT